jgi:hypothetical protein
MGILYKKLNVTSRALLHYEQALEIRRDQIGPLSLPVSNILEQLGKFHLELADYQRSYTYLHECYIIRKQLLSVSHKRDKAYKLGQEGNIPNESPEITRVSVLMLYLHQKIQEELNEKTNAGLGRATEGKNGLKLLQVSFDVKTMLGEEVARMLDGTSGETKTQDLAENATKQGP